MGFNVLTVRSRLDPGDDALYPLLSDASGPEIIAMDSYDGPSVSRTVATSVSVREVAGAGLKTVASVRDVKIEVFITDSRLALACEKYDKGGGWSGFGGVGLMVALTANAVSKARAARRRRGKALVGQVRYPWLKAVGASSKTGFTSSEAIRVEYAQQLAGRTVTMILELTLPKNIDSTLVAQEIIRRAAAYRLAYYPDMPAGQRPEFTRLAQTPPRLQPPPKKFAVQQLPAYYFAGAQTAFPATHRPGTRAPDHGVPLAGTPRPADATEIGPPAAATGTDPRPAPVFCRRCGTRGEPGDNFCQECGVPLHPGHGHSGDGHPGDNHPGDGHRGIAAASRIGPPS